MSEQPSSSRLAGPGNPRATPKRPKSTRQLVEDHAPWKPYPYEPADASALQALMRGDCPPSLQQRAIKFIMWDLCGLRDLSFRPGAEGQRDTDFAEGKRFVGLQIAKLLEVKVNPGGEQG